MSEEDFEEEAKKRGWVRQERQLDLDEADSNKKEKSCFDNCFGRGGRKRKDARQSPLETVRESAREDDEDPNRFEFVPHTQTQKRERDIPSTAATTTPIPKRHLR